MRRTATCAQQRRSGAILPRPEPTGGAGGDRSHRARSLVRAVAGGTEVRAVGGRSGADSGPASAKAEDRPSGCPTPAEVAGGGSLPAGVGSGFGESGSAPTALASAPAGADADAGHESVAGHSPERRGAAQEGTVEQAGARAVGVFATGSLGRAAPARPAGTAAGLKSEHRGIERRDRAGSRAAGGGEAADDSPRCGSPNRLGLRADHRVSGTLSLRQADRQLP